MTDADRFKLLGTYRTPRVRIGRVLACEARDCDVVVTGYSSGRIAWSVGRRAGTHAFSLAAFRGLVEAVRPESGRGGIGRRDGPADVPLPKMLAA
jgi:hypothetical protein